MLIGEIVFLPFLAAPIAYVLGRKQNTEKWRDGLCAAVTVMVLLLCLNLFGGSHSLDINGVFVYGLHFQTDGFRAVYATITAVMWVGTTLFSFEYFLEEREGLAHYWFFVLLTFGATEGVMLSADLMTAFVFFEILSLTSFTWVIHEETPEAIRAGFTYLFIALIGGFVLFMGLLLLRHACGTLVFSELGEAAAAADNQKEILAAAICILYGFGAKAGMFPLHVWLPKAHPVAPSPASALLSGILTKVGVYGILMTVVTAMAGSRTFGVVVLVHGVITMALGAVLALFSINLKRTLACSSMSQIGFILTGTGMYMLLNAAGNEEAAQMTLAGVMLHMTNHSLIKLTLFMCSGVVIMNLHTLILDQIRGWGRGKWGLKIAFALGGLGISGVPGFNGYLSKTLLHEGIVEGAAEYASYYGILKVVEWIFLISGGLTFAYMLKLFICVFVQKNTDAALQRRYDAQPHCMNKLSETVIVGSSLLMPILGQPAVSTRLGALMTGSDAVLAFRPFTWGNLSGGLTSLVIGAAVYLVIVRHVMVRKNSYVNLWPAWLDLENLVYRPLLTRILPGIGGAVASVFGENKVLTPFSREVLAVGGEVASIFGENKVLTPAARVTVKGGGWLAAAVSYVPEPIAKGVLLIGSVVGRALSDSLDALIVLLRRTIFRERRSRRPDQGNQKLAQIREGTAQVEQTLSGNFTFAMLMTCIGLLIVLGLVVVMSM